MNVAPFDRSQESPYEHDPVLSQGELQQRLQAFKEQWETEFQLHQLKVL